MKRSGFTLMEVLLVLALLVVVLGLLGMAIDIHLRVADGSRNAVEETQLAHLVLQRMGDDLRNASPFVQSSSLGGTGSTGGQDASQKIFFLGGIIGASGELSLNMSCLPLLAQSPATESAGDNSPSDGLSSDVRTVTYRVVKPGDSGPLSPAGAGSEPCGLVRGEWDRARYAWAIQQGQTSEINRGMKVLAPEVEKIEFSYYDGSTWYQEWDTFQQNKLPAAVKIAISLHRPAWKAQRPSAGGADRKGEPTVYETLVYLPNALATLDQATATVSPQSAPASPAGNTSNSGANAMAPTGSGS
jgi:prepilin-type N-terminal cleavage/methylation domain-containing protein